MPQIPGTPEYRRGHRGTAVSEIRSRLTRLGLVDTDPADPAEFDDALDRAVRAFQQQRGLSVDGIVGPTTYRVLDEARWRLGDRLLTFVPGSVMSGDDVVALQQRLLDLGFQVGRVDGRFGHRTELAVREFQRNVGVPADGTCGPATLKALARLAPMVRGGRPNAMRDRGAAAHGRPPADRQGRGDRPLRGPDGGARPRRPGGGDHLRPGQTGGGSPGGHGRAGLPHQAAGARSRRRSSGPSSRTGPTPTCASRSRSTRPRTRARRAARRTSSAWTPTAPGPRRASASRGWSSARSWRGPTCSTCARTRRTGTCSGTPGCPPCASTSDTSRTPGTPPARDEAFRDVVAEAVVVAVQRMYLSPETDAQTGVLRFDELRAALR